MEFGVKHCGLCFTSNFHISLILAFRMRRNDNRRNENDLSDEDTVQVKYEMSVDKDLSDELSSTRVATIKDEVFSRSNTPMSTASRIKTSHSSSASTPRAKSENEEPSVKLEDKHINGHDSPEMDSLPPKKGARGSKKVVPRVAPLFNDLPDATDEANSSYQVIESCSYQNKYLGYTEHAMECDCSEEWGKS